MTKRTWRDALAAYASPATLALLLLGFAAGLPYMLVFATLSVWLREAGVSLQAIGFASLIGLAYAFKWVWAPMLDQWRLPLLGRLGRRRSWLVLSQCLVMLGLVGMAFLPQLYIVYLSFRNSSSAMFLPGYSLDNYRMASTRLLGRSIWNTLYFGGLALAIIIVLSIVIAYLVVRRSNFANNLIDTLSMIPYILPGAVIGIGLVLAFNGGPLALTGTVAIMIIALVIRRMPYTIRSATATLMHLPISTEEAARSLGASKLKTFFRITTPMMAAGITSGAILSFVAIVTEMSSAIILYNNKTITLTMSAYVAISRGNYGLACAFSAILTVLTGVILLIYLRFTREEDIRM